MLRSLTTIAAICLSSYAFAETHEVKMLNRGEAGVMVFEPDFLRVAPGDTVVFLPTDRGHNAESVTTMMPDGAEAFKGPMNREVEAVFEIEGLYGVMCKPHFSMGMVMTIAVGDDVAVPDDYFGGRIPRKAKQRFEEQLENL